MKPPGTENLPLPSGASWDTCKLISGITDTEFAKFRSFKEIYPFILKLLDSTKVVVAHGPDGDISGLGLRLLGTQVRDTGSFYPSVLLARAAAASRGVTDPPGLEDKAPWKYGLEALIEGFTGEKFRRPGGPHSSFTDTLLCWAIYMKSPNLFEKYAKEFAKVHRARLVGTGAPLPAVRAAYLPQSELTGSIPLNVD